MRKRLRRAAALALAAVLLALSGCASGQEERRGLDGGETSVVLTTGRRPFLEEFLRDGRDARFTGEAMPLEPYMLRSPDNFAHGKI